MLKRIGLLTLALVTALTGPAHAAEQPWRLEITDRGAQVSYRDVPIVFPYGTYVVKPGWTGVIFRSSSYPPKVQTLDNGRKFVGESHNDNFKLRYELTLLDENRVRFDVSGVLTKDQPARIEHGFGKLNANLVANRPYRLTGPHMQPVEGTIPTYPASDDVKDTHLPSELREARFDSRIGELTLRFSTPDEEVVFKDGRGGTSGWARHYPCFWMGVNGTPEVGKPFKASMVIELKPKQPWANEASVTVDVATTQQPQAAVPVDHGLRIIPKPRTLAAGEGVLTLSDRTWQLHQPAGETRLAKAIGSIVDGEFGAGAPQVQAHDSDGLVRIIVGEPGDAPGGDWRKNDEGYYLRVTGGGLLIAATTPRGAFYGLQSLAQLMKTGDGGGLTVPAVEVEDWPALAYRGVHWYPSKAGVPFHRNTIERIFARYKINQSVIECEGARWDSHPEIAAPESISTRDLREIVQLCRDNFIEPAPLINIPGHARWVFRNGQNKELAEDPDALYAYNVKDPRSYAFITDLLTEAIDIFQPKYFHLGHDEVTMSGKFPNPDHPLYEGESLNELMSMHLTRLHGWLAERGIETMVWSDMFISEYEAKGDLADHPETVRAREIRTMIPKDAIMADWHYSNWENYPSLPMLEEEGFRTVACTWFRPENIYYFTHAAAEAGSWGLMQTTWAGFFPDESSLMTDLRQFSAYILAAEYAWSMRDEKPEELPYEADTVFAESYYAESGSPQAGALVDLSPAVNLKRADGLGLGEGWDLNDAPSGVVSLEGVRFNIPADGWVVVGGPMAPGDAPDGVTLNVGGVNGTHLALLHAAVWDTYTETPIAKVRVIYTDGSSDELTITNGYTGAAWAKMLPALRARVAWKADAPLGQSKALRITRWELPRPGRAIDSIVLESADDETAWLVAGVTVLGGQAGPLP